MHPRCEQNPFHCLVPSSSREGTAGRTGHVPKLEPPCPALSFEDGNRVGKVRELVPGVWLRRTGITNKYNIWKRGKNASAEMGRSGGFWTTIFSRRRGGTAMSAVLLCCWAQLKVDAEKKGGGARKEAAVSRSRNYAFGKPGSMEPDSSLNL